MKREFISKIMAAMLLGGMFGWFIHYGLVTWNHRGREAFIAYQAHRFDLNYVNPSPLVSNVAAMALFAIGGCVLYELVAYCLLVLMKRVAPERNPS